MDPGRIVALREVLAGSGWLDGARNLATALRRPAADPHGLLLVGTPEAEPWHLAAHLDDEARLSDLPQLSPTLVRHDVPLGAPPHLSVGMCRLEQARRGETVFVVNPGDAAPWQLLERVEGAKRTGATILALDRGDRNLAGLAHEQMVVGPSGLAIPRHLLDDTPGDLEPQNTDDPMLGFDVAQHLVSVEAGQAITAPDTVPLGWRERLGRLLDAVTSGGPR